LSFTVEERVPSETSSHSLFEPVLAAERRRVLVCGLPGSGYVGKLAAEHIIDSFKAKKFKEFYSNSFPPHVNVKEDGRVQSIKGELYIIETGQGKDVLVFTADAQPTTSAGEYELSAMLLADAKKMGVNLVVSLAAYITGGFTSEQRVFGASTSSSLNPMLAENGIKVMKEGGISGMNGVVIGMAKLYGIDGICLLGETSGYMIDPGASQAVLEALSRVLKIEMDLSTLKEKAKEAKQIIGEIQRMTEQQQGVDTRRQSPGGRPGYIG
jgi:uncharacterized protein